MKISHKITNISGEDFLYIFVTVEDIYEFGKENLDKGENTNFLIKLREYVSKNFKNSAKASAIIVINGVILGSLTLASLYANTDSTSLAGSNIPESIYSETTTSKPNLTNEEKAAEQIGSETKKEEKYVSINTANTDTNKEENKNANKTSKTNNKVSSTNSAKKNTSNKTNTSKKSNTTKKTTSTTNKTSVTNKNTNASTKKPSTTTATTSKPNTNASTNTTTNTSTSNSTSTNTNTSIKPSTNTNTTTKLPSGHTIKLNNGGTVVTLDLEEYIIGVVAAEMPASFHLEALKAQAVVARTYAMKKASKGKTLQNSTYHQVYNTTSQLKAKWGSSYNTYYNKVKNAVNATKGMVLKYKGTYIEALYFSMSNGKTELPSYVWTTDYPYLKVVSSSWDENISGSKYTMSFTYDKLSEKLGITINENSEIIVLSKTPGDRINEISIAGKTFKGTKIKALLGLRSTDFSITKTSTGLTITTIGFGHGVGMSQYGANGAAKSGMTYKQILNHYYSGATLVKI